MAFFFYQGAQLGFRLVSKTWGRGWGLSFCLKQCCFSFRVRVRLGLGLGLGLVSTLTLTIIVIVTLKQHSLNIRQTPTPAPNPTPISSPRFTDTRLLPHKPCKNLHSSGVYTSPCNSATVPVRSKKLRTLPQVPCKRKADPISQVFVRSKLCPGPSKGGQPLRQQLYFYSFYSFPYF